VTGEIHYRSGSYKCLTVGELKKGKGVSTLRFQSKGGRKKDLKIKLKMARKIA